MHESQPTPESQYPGTEALDQNQVKSSGPAQEAAPSALANTDAPAETTKRKKKKERRTESDTETDADKKPRVPLSERLKPLVNAIGKLPNPAKVLPRKSQRVAAASGLSAAALGAATLWSQLFGNAPNTDTPALAGRPAAASGKELPDSEKTAGTTASPRLSIQAGEPEAPNPTALVQTPPPDDQNLLATARDETNAPPAPTPLAAAEVVAEPMATPEALTTDLNESAIPPIPTAMAPAPLSKPDPASALPPAGDGSQIVVPPPTLLTQENPGDLAPEAPPLTDLAGSSAPLAPAPLGQFSEPPLPVDSQPTITNPGPDLANIAPQTDPVHNPLPTEGPTTLEPGIPNLAATPEPAPIAAPDTSFPSEPAFPEMNQAEMVALPNSGLKALSLDQPVGEARPIEPAPTSVALASASPIAGGAQAQLAITDAFEPVLHVVQNGENFWSISRLYYGSGRFYKALWKANSDQFRTPEDLHVGAKIKVPPPEALDRSLIEPTSATEPRSASAPAPAASPTRTPTAGAIPNKMSTLPSGDTLRPTRGTLDSAPPLRDSGRIHVVETDNETLRTVARDELGDSHREDEILNLNLDILEGRSRLVRGMRLRLPDEPQRIGRR